MSQVAMGRSQYYAGANSGVAGPRLSARAVAPTSGRCAAAPDAAAARTGACAAAAFSGRGSTRTACDPTSPSSGRDRGLASARAMLCCRSASSSSVLTTSGAASTSTRCGSPIQSQPHNRRCLGRAAASPRHQHHSCRVPYRSAVAVASAASAASASDRESMEVPFVVESSGLSVTMRKVSTLDELRQVATLRADAYYAENQSRFVGSLKKKFVEQEVESLQQRTSATSKQSGTPFCECLVAVEAGSSTVLGCIDMRLPAALSGAHPAGVPADDTGGCYLLNVVVREDVRGQGLGRAIMRAAMARAVRTWGAQRLYTHVEADNEVAYNLYAGCGFTKHSADARYDAETKLGQTVLLLAPADLVLQELGKSGRGGWLRTCDGGGGAGRDLIRSSDVVAGGSQGSEDEGSGEGDEVHSGAGDKYKTKWPEHVRLLTVTVAERLLLLSAGGAATAAAGGASAADSPAAARTGGGQHAVAEVAGPALAGAVQLAVTGLEEAEAGLAEAAEAAGGLAEAAEAAGAASVAGPVPGGQPPHAPPAAEAQQR
ncbi:hypothetical protein HYH02_007551 [Chlamydomonas schloesseri]|uniref:N-acetyltransferase domain-containing protein n=1 Tax=Chlamydomonas schloesseri TaxID=2026947 RepID=A0A835WHW5_9CHLO|nr:hypothetical protein HYH02_007551 [Chlamydomonas schloesseri]|eukprot:KAG2447633.1 hypothetical protein HYH02_007551 [Chlamydomonas schloesseri]